MPSAASGFFLDHPIPFNDEFVAWADAVGGLTRYPELLGWGEVVMVTQAQLDLYAAYVAEHPAGVVSGAFEITPPGMRVLLPLLRRTEPQPREGAPAGFDYCAGTAGEPILAARDTGRSSYQAVDTGTMLTLAVQVPIYRDGVTPATVDGRREAFVGWVGLGFDPEILLAQALRDHPTTSVRLSFHDPLSDAAFTSGPAPRARGASPPIWATGGQSKPWSRCTAPGCSPTAVPTSC